MFISFFLHNYIFPKMKFQKQIYSLLYLIVFLHKKKKKKIVFLHNYNFYIFFWLQKLHYRNIARYLNYLRFKFNFLSSRLYY